MKVNQSVNWVALPSGLAEDGSLRLSVFVAPQLGVQPDEAAGQPAAGHPYDAWPALTAYALFENWAAEAAGVGFAVEVDGRPIVAARRVSEPPSAELWSQLFGPETRVEPFVMDRPDIATTNTYDVATIVESLQEGYGHAALYEPPDFDLPLEIPVEPDVEDPLSGGVPVGGGQPIVMELFPDLVEVATSEGFGFLVGGDQDVLVQGVNDLLAAARTRAAWAEAEQAAPAPAVGIDDPLAVAQPLPTFTAANALLPPDGSRAGEWGRLLAFRRVGELLASDRAYDLGFGGDLVLPLEEVDGPEAFRRSFDLHKMLAALGDHPA
ncbi:MAG: hypothetical protein Q8K72_06380, partial [Acidimicrobiales bacterium]|nr:hypothetical protein [Acidimicrobiales bacterium]